MALSSATNPTLDGVKRAEVCLYADDSASELNQIPWPCQSVSVIGVTNNAQDYIVLPAIAEVPVGHEIVIENVAGSDFNLVTPASSNTKINNIDSDGTAEYRMTDGEIVRLIKRGNTPGWVAYGYTYLGAQASAVVPVGISFSPSISRSVSPSLSPSISPSKSPSISPSISSSLSQSLSPSISSSISPSISPSLSQSLSPSISQSISPSVSPPDSFSPSISPSLSPSISTSTSPSQSLSPSLSPSLSTSKSPSISPSASPSA